MKLETLLNKLNKYQFFKELDTYIKYGENGLYIIGYFPYRQASVLGTFISSKEVQDLINILREGNVRIDNKWCIIFSDGSVIYLHDGFGRKVNSINELTSYGKDKKPLTKKEYEEREYLASFPSNMYKNIRDWKYDVRSRFNILNSVMKEMLHGSVYYPPKMREWMDEFDKEITSVMKKYLKK